MKRENPARQPSSRTNILTSRFDQLFDLVPSLRSARPDTRKREGSNFRPPLTAHEEPARTAAGIACTAYRPSPSRSFRIAGRAERCVGQLLDSVGYSRDAGAQLAVRASFQVRMSSFISPAMPCSPPRADWRRAVPRRTRAFGPRRCGSIRSSVCPAAATRPACPNPLILLPVRKIYTNSVI